MKTLWIVSNFFAPLNIVAARRFTDMIPYMERQGFRVFVIAEELKRTTFCDARLDLECEIDEDRIKRIKNTERDTRGWNPLINYVRDSEAKGIYFNALNMEAVNWYRNVKHAYRTGVFDKWPAPDVIAGTCGQVGNLYAARYLGRVFGVPCVADIRDFITEFSNYGNKLHGRFDRIFEWSLLRSFTAVTAVTEGIARTYQSKYHKPCAVVYNGWTKVSTTPQADDVFSRYECYYYNGMWYDFRVEAALELAQMIHEVNQREHREIRFVIRSIGPKPFEREFLVKAKALGVQKDVILLPGAPANVVNYENTLARVNVVLTNPSTNQADHLIQTISSKVFELLLYDAPILAIASKQSEVAKVLRSCNKGLASNDNKEIREFIRNRDLAAEFTGDKRQIHFYGRKHQAARMCRFLDEIVWNGSGSRPVSRGISFAFFGGAVRSNME